MVGLGFLPFGGYFSEAFGVNADGTVVVGVGSATGINQEAFRWTQAGGMQSVQALLTAEGVSTTGWTLTSAQGVSADGQVIVGYGTNPSGRLEGWIARLSVPFLAFNATLTIDFGGPPPEDTFNLHSSFTLSSTAPGSIPSPSRSRSRSAPSPSPSRPAPSKNTSTTRTGFSASRESSTA
jgi:probable HAF family extracellular repeat protein